MENDNTLQRTSLSESDDDTIIEGTSASKTLNINSESSGIDFDSLLAHTLQYLNIGNCVANISKKAEYVVQIPLKYQESFNKGEVFLNKSKNGLEWATLVKKGTNGRTQFVDNLPIKEESIIQGNPFLEIAQGYQNIYLQEQLDKLADKLDKTYKAVEAIEHGQLDDRIGQLISGKNQFLLAMGLPDEERNLAIANARSSISEAQAKIFESLKRRVNNFSPIPVEWWKSFFEEVKHEGFYEEKYNEYNDIQDYYELYLYATDLLAASYSYCGNLDTAEKVYDQSIGYIKGLNFNNVKTIEYVRGTEDDMLYDYSVEYLIAEKDKYLSDVKQYDCLAIEVPGEKLLEDLNHENI